MSLLESLAQNDEQLSKFLQGFEQDALVLDKENHPNVPQTRNQFDMTVSQLNGELEHLGLTGVLCGPNGKDVSAEKAFIVAVDALWSLIKHNRQISVQKDELGYKLRRKDQELLEAKAGAKRHQAVSESLEATVQSMKKEGMSIKRQHDEYKAKSQKEITMLKAQVANLIQVEKKLQNELRKKDREREKVQAQMQTLLFDKRKLVRPSVEIHGELDPTKFVILEAKMDGNCNASESFCKMVAASYEHRQQELLNENDELRQSIRNVQAHMKSMIEQAATSKEDAAKMEASDKEPTTSMTPSTPRMELLPVQFIRQEVNDSIQVKINLLNSRLEGCHTELPSEPKEPSEATEQPIVSAKILERDEIKLEKNAKEEASACSETKMVRNVASTNKDESLLAAPVKESDGFSARSQETFDMYPLACTPCAKVSMPMTPLTLSSPSAAQAGSASAARAAAESSVRASPVLSSSPLMISSEHLSIFSPLDSNAQSRAANRITAPARTVVPQSQVRYTPSPSAKTLLASSPFKRCTDRNASKPGVASLLSSLDDDHDMKAVFAPNRSLRASVDSGPRTEEQPHPTRSTGVESNRPSISFAFSPDENTVIVHNHRLSSLDMIDRMSIDSGNDQLFQ